MMLLYFCVTPLNQNIPNDLPNVLAGDFEEIIGWIKLNHEG